MAAKRWTWLVVLSAGLHLGCGSSGGEEGEPDVPAGCTSSADCDGGFCEPASGQCLVCEPGVATCTDGAVVVCSADGSAYGDPVSCGDSDPCTDDGVCEAGVCTAATLRTCDDADPCTIDFCEPKSGACETRPSNVAGCCTAPADCDDGLSCTDDVCAPDGACQNVGGPCFPPEPTVIVATKGAEPGALDGPRGVAVLSSGEVAVADSSNNRVQVYSSAGVFVREWAPSPTLGPFKLPSGLEALPDGRLAVADTGNDRVVLLASDTAPEAALTLPDELDAPTDVVQDPQGRGVWVANSGKSNLLLFDFEGALVDTLGKKGDAIGSFRTLRGVGVLGSQTLVASDSELQRVTMYDLPSRTPTLVFGVEGAGSGELRFPGGLVGLPGGILAVADAGNGRVQFFRTCAPTCGEGVTCGGNGCGGSCGTCVGPEAACVEGQCTGPTLGGAGCAPSVDATGGCAGCGCEDCVCGQDPFCCDSAWDDVCAVACSDPCGAVCAQGPADITPVSAPSSLLDTGGSPNQIALSPDGVLWVVDNAQSRLLAFPLQF